MSTPDELANYEDVVYLIVEDSFDASSQSPTVPEVAKRTKAWARLLFGIIPEEYLQESFDIAFDLHDSTFAVNAYEIKNAYLNHILPRIEKEKAKALASNPIARCPQYQNHVGDKDKGEMLTNLYEDGEDSKAPCWFCRAEKYEDWKKTQIALYGQPKTVSIPVSKSAYEPSVFVSPFKSEDLSDDEIDSLVDEHNKLVCRIVTDGSQKDLVILYNESMKMFKHPNRRNLLFSAKDIRQKISSYKRILEEREN